MIWDRIAGMLLGAAMLSLLVIHLIEMAGGAA